VPLGDVSTAGNAAAQRLRELASRGELSAAFAGADTESRRCLDRALYTIVWPIVFERITRTAEKRRGHHLCARAVDRMGPDCLDRFHDDVAAVIQAVVQRTTTRVEDLDAWITAVARFAVVDAYRKRRGAIGAQQRPRLPRWLIGQLGEDPWQTALALRILEWVGVPATAGHQLWPLDSWTAIRAQVTGDWIRSSPEVVAREVDRVLTAMRIRPRWYADNVERPLGHKQAPTAGRSGQGADVPLLESAGQDGRTDSALLTAADVASSVIAERLGRGEDPYEVVKDVVLRLFCDTGPLSPIAAAPHATSADAWLEEQLVTPPLFDRVVAEVVAVVRPDGVRRTG